MGLPVLTKFGIIPHLGNKMSIEKPVEIVQDPAEIAEIAKRLKTGLCFVDLEAAAAAEEAETAAQKRFAAIQLVDIPPSYTPSLNLGRVSLAVLAGAISGAVAWFTLLHAESYEILQKIPIPAHH